MDLRATSPILDRLAAPKDGLASLDTVLAARLEPTSPCGRRRATPTQAPLACSLWTTDLDTSRSWADLLVRCPPMEGLRSLAIESTRSPLCLSRHWRNTPGGFDGHSRDPGREYRVTVA